jgi:hypothetical protein
LFPRLTGTAAPEPLSGRWVMLRNLEAEGVGLKVSGIYLATSG